MLTGTPAHLSGSSRGEDDGHVSYAVGDQISPDIFISDKELNKLKLMEICHHAEARVNVLYIYGGGAYKKNRIGGIWCRDSFEDFHVMRYIFQKYDDTEVQIIPVACPPVYASHFYGFDRRVFLDEPDVSPRFKENAKAFVESTESVVQNEFIPVDTYYDFGNRLLFNRRKDLKAGPGYGPVHSWQGKFRSNHEMQKYGTPTIWLLNRKGVILEDPFWGNLYHTDPYLIRYTVVDVDNAIQKNL